MVNGAFDRLFNKRIYFKLHMKKRSDLSQSLRSFFCLDALFLMSNLVQRNLKIRYRKSFLGYLWTLLVPISLASIYYFTFSLVLRVQSENFAAVLICGVTLWGFVSMTLFEGMEGLLSNFNLLRQVKVPINCFAMASALSNFFTLLVSLPVVLCVFFFSNTPLHIYMLLSFYFIILLFFLVYGLAYMASIFVVYVRDLKQGLNIIVQILFYATPIVYSANLIPEKYRWILYMNPFGHLFMGIQSSLMHQGFAVSEVYWVPFVWTVFVITAAYLSHQVLRRSVVEMI